MTDWIMISITAVYVAATIFICLANIKSAKATQEQVAEMKRQFDEENRPHISVEIIYEKRIFWGLRFFNFGKKTANHVKIQFEQSFIDSIKEPEFTSILQEQKGRECIIGIGQHYDIFFGTNKYRENQDKALIAGTVSYRCDNHDYVEAFSIDTANYTTFFSINTEMDDLLKKISDQNNQLEHIAVAIENSKERHDQENV